jgi:Lon protease-like protein
VIVPRATLQKSLGRLKIFPLPTAVLLPGAVIPLHIFEPRYRKMISDALEADRILAMGMLDAGWEADYHGRPRVRPILGLGQIVTDERLADGRFNIQVVGVGRAELIEELPAEEPYRLVRARFPDEVEPAQTHAAATLRNAVLSLCALLPDEQAQGLARAAGGVKSAGELADICTAALATDAPSRQKVLEELAVERRLQLALDVVGEALLRAQSEPSAGGALN